ncbi:MAG: hypothetical protein HZB39_04715 [Planctomycetes bacterium]|nr:hypothetical protein [Planctomycetota bacterium]
MTRHGVVLCEGYHDRAVWSGWLTARGWKSMRPLSGKALDPRGRELPKGAFAFRRGHAFVTLVPCGGWTEILRLFALEAQEAFVESGSPNAVDFIAACFDADIAGADHGQSIRDRWRKATGHAPPPRDDWRHEGIAVHVVRFTAGEARWRSSLDGLVARSFAEAYPARWRNVEAWLESREDKPEPSKEAMWSVMAGWFPEQGESFLQHGIWHDQSIRDRLTAHLDELGITRVVEAMEA